MDDNRLGQMTLLQGLLNLNDYAFAIFNGHPASKPPSVMTVPLPLQTALHVSGALPSVLT